MSERVAIHVRDSQVLLAELRRAQRAVGAITDELTPLVREAGSLLNESFDWQITAPLNSAELGLGMDHDDLDWRIDYLITADLNFDVAGRELALLPSERPDPVDANAWVVANELARIIDTYTDANGDRATLADVDELLAVLRSAEHDPKWLADMFRRLGAERTFELSVAITSFAFTDEAGDGLTADLLEMRESVAASLAVASTATVINKQGERVRVIDESWFDDLWSAANVGEGYLHADWVDLFDTDQPFHRDVAIHVGTKALELLAADLQSTGSYHELHIPELDLLSIHSHIRTSEELAATLLNVTMHHPANAAGVLLAPTSSGVRGVDVLADRSSELGPGASELLAELAMAGTVHAQAASIVDGMIVHRGDAEQALHATGSLIEAIADAEAHNPSADPYDLALAAGFANIVINTLPHALRVESTGHGVFIIATDDPIPSSSAGIEVDPIDLSYAFGSLFRHDVLRIEIGGQATAAARELLLEDPSLENHGAVGMINAVLINGLNRSGIQDAAAQQRAVDEFNEKANEIWGNATFAVGLLPGGGKAITVVSQGENVLELVGVDLQDTVIGAARDQFGPPDPEVTQAQASVAATQSVGGATRATSLAILAAAFETMQAELRAGLAVDELTPTSRAILQHIESSTMSPEFVRGSSRYTELIAVANQEMASLSLRLDEQEFEMMERMQWSQLGAVEWLDESSEFSG